MPEWKDRIRERLTDLMIEPTREAEIIEELAQHLGDRHAELIAGGATELEASRTALAELSESGLLQQELRRVERTVSIEPIVPGAGGKNLIGELLLDLRYGLRMFGKNRGFTFVATLTLALGIGANTMIFSLVNATLFRPLPVVRDPEKLVWLRGSSSYPNYEEYRDQNDVFSGITAMSGTNSFIVSEGGRPEIVKGEFVTANYFSVLGVDAALGRAFLPEEDAAGSHPAVIIGNSLWRRRFGADPDLVGKTITVSGLQLVVVGIAPRGFIGSEVGLPRDLWVPMTMFPRMTASSTEAVEESEPDRLHDRNNYWLNVVGRLRPGVSIKQAEAAMVTIAIRLSDADNVDEGTRNERVRAVALLRVIGGLDPRDRIDAATVAGFLMAVVGLVLLIACANVAGLLLGRALSRQKEMAIRQAIGANRFRIIRQSLTESTMLSVLGGSAGLLLAVWGKEMLVHLSRSTPLADVDMSLDWRVFVFTLAASLFTTLIFGLAPALQASRTDLTPALKGSFAPTMGFRRSRLRNAFVIAQLALSLFLLIGSGLFIRSLQNAQNVDPGFALENGLLASVSPGLLRYSEERGQEFYRQAIERIDALPGVERASFLNIVPLGLSSADGSVVAEGQETSPDGLPVLTGFNIVGVDYFQTMGIPLVRGRDFGPQDRKEAPGVVVVNETLARRLFPDQDPIGKRVRFGGSKAPFVEVIGVARDSKYATLGEKNRPFIYQPLLQNYRGTMTMVVRGRNDVGALSDGVRSEIQALDSNLPVSDIKTLTEQVDFSLLPARLAASFLGAFGLLALLLATVGIYGLMTHLVRSRTREIGVRMSLGAQRSDVLKLVVKEGMVIAAIGVAIGLALAFAATRLIASFLYGVSATDLTTFVLVPWLLAGAALLACLIPARRATKIDPLIALRCE